MSQQQAASPTERSAPDLIEAADAAVSDALPEETAQTGASAHAETSDTEGNTADHVLSEVKCDSFERPCKTRNDTRYKTVNTPFVQPDFFKEGDLFDAYDDFNNRLKEYVAANQFAISRKGHYFRCQRAGVPEGSNKDAIENRTSRQRDSIKCGCNWSVRVCKHCTISYLIACATLDYHRNRL
jgi:hypothetical protein